MAPTARHTPPRIEPILHECEISDEDNQIEFGVPSLHNIIPWSGPRRRPRQPPVYDAVRTVLGINVRFLENMLRSYHAMLGIITDVRVEYHAEAPMDTPDISQRNILTQVDVDALLNGKKQTFHLVIKTLTTSQPVRTLCAAHHFDKRETGLYLEVLEDINIFQQQQIENPDKRIALPSPTCYFARYKTPNTERGIGGYYTIPPDESVVVLENLKHQGYTQTLLDQGLSKRQVMTVLDRISRIHGLSLAMKERSGIPLHMSYNYLVCITEAGHCLLDLFDKNMPPLINIFKAYGRTDVFDKVMNLRPHLGGIVDRLIRPKEPMSVLSHMNLWAHNILFKGEDECVFVDWQMITRAKPTFDVAYLLATSVSTKMRRDYGTEFLDYYYRHFLYYSRKYGLDPLEDLGYTREDLWHDFRCSQLLTMLFCVGKKNELLNTKHTQRYFVDFMNELESQRLLRPDGIDFHTPEWTKSIVRSPVEPKPYCSLELGDSDEEGGEISSIFPVKELTKE